MTKEVFLSFGFVAGGNLWMPWRSLRRFTCWLPHLQLLEVILYAFCIKFPYLYQELTVDRDYHDNNLDHILKVYEQDPMVFVGGFTVQ